MVHSPEQYRLELPLAGPTSRILAYAIDYLVILTIQVVLITLVVLLLPVGDQLESMFEDFSRAVEEDDPKALESWGLMLLGFMVVTQLVVEWGYFVLLEATTQGRSLGKAIVKLRVVGDGGHPLSLTQSIARNLLRAADMLPGYYVVGLISMIVLDEGKRLGDLAAGTVVIRLDRPASAPLVTTEPSRAAEVFRFDHQQIARLGQPEERLVRQTLRRLTDLPADQAEVALERTVNVIVSRIEHETVPSGQQEEFLRALLRTVERR